MRHGTWTETGGGGGGGGLVVVAVLALLVIGSGAVAAVASVIAALVTVIAIAGGVFAFAIGAAVLVFLARTRQRDDRERQLVPRPQFHQLGGELPAIERPAEQHIHFHGVSAADVAEILRRNAQDN
jgi:membrane protein implicated in regulation of membrane protease activity